VEAPGLPCLLPFPDGLASEPFLAALSEGLGLPTLELVGLGLVADPKRSLIFLLTPPSVVSPSLFEPMLALLGRGGAEVTSWSLAGSMARETTEDFRG
jgi:hypothetical protein